MVAYSFQARFVDPIRSGAKRQTLRGPRRRHARPGETVQLYHGMRTRNCFPILPEHPTCTSVARVDVSFEDGRVTVALDGVRLPPDDLEAFARADGFGSVDVTAPADFGDWWGTVHGGADVEGLTLIGWEAPRVPSS